LHYISLWEMAEIGRIVRRRIRVRRDLRGYAMQPLPPDRRVQSLSVSELANTICSTHRDIYLSKVARVRPNRRERPWQAEAGTLTHKLLQALHAYAKQRLPTNGANFDVQTLFRRLKAYGVRQKNLLLSEYRDDPRFDGRVLSDLDSHFNDIVFFESLLTCALLTYKASRKTVLATGANIDPTQEFEQLFDFSAIEQNLSASLLGLTEPVTPDFLYARRVIGDIKTGAIQEESFLMTCVAYALAYEAEYRRNIDFGLILHIDLSHDHPFPVYQGSRLYEINDNARRRFTILRDQKLDVLVQRVEPIIQPDEPRCRPCGFYSRCWGGRQND